MRFTERAAVYPNPATDLLTLKHMRGKVSVYDHHGASVQQGVIQPNAPFQLSVRDLPNGLYYVVGQEANGQAVRQTVQVQH